MEKGTCDVPFLFIARVEDTLCRGFGADCVPLNGYMGADSVKRKFKDKHFAAGCSRDVIRQGAENLGWELKELFEKTILAMRDCEASVREELPQLVERAASI